MANKIADTVTSIRRHGEYDAMTLEYDNRLVRFRCSCGVVGGWYDRDEVRYALAMACLRWTEHVEVEHDE